MATRGRTERLADYFVAYLFDNYRGTRHVRRVATWIGFLLKAIERLPGASFSRSRKRQLTFSYRGRRLKVRYEHSVGSRGGIQFVEVLPGRGAPEGAVALNVKNLADAENTYRDLR